MLSTASCKVKPRKNDCVYGRKVDRLMNILLTEIFGLLHPFVDSYIKSVVDKAGLNYTGCREEISVIKRERKKTISELHSLIDVNEDNGLITSERFYNFVKYNASDLIYQVLEINSNIISNVSSECQVKELIVLYNTEFCGISLYEKNLGVDFIKRFFEVCFRFKKNLFISLIHEDAKPILEYEINDNLVLKISENIKTTLDYFRIAYNHIELNRAAIQEIEYSSLNIEGRKTIEIFSSLFEEPLIFEEKQNAKKLKDVFVWPEYRSCLLKDAQDDLKQVISEFLKGNLKLFLYDKGIAKYKVDKDYSLLVILGMGGMGKSSLLEKIAYDIFHGTIKLNVNKVFFVKFSSMECKYNNLFKNIVSYLDINKEILRNSVIILDAFDEFVLKNAEKQKMIELFCREIQLLNCRVVITSRENYIDTDSLQNTFTIKLLTFNINKRKEWLKKYNKNLPLQVVNDVCSYHDENDLYGEEFIGIPIIIYMVASNCIRISDYSSKFEFYNALFGLNGIWNKRMYDISHPVLLTRYEVMFEFILKISEVMFQKNRMSIHHKEINQIIDNMIPQKDVTYLQNWYGIITYFKENKLREIEFAHKSIFEYYIAHRIFNQLTKVVEETDEAKKSQILQRVFNKNIVTKEMLYFLDGFIEKNYENFPYDDVKNTVKLILNKDVLFESYGRFENFEEVCNYFCNSFNCLIRILSKKRGNTLLDVFDKHTQEHFSFFLRNKVFNYLYMRRFDLSNKCFRGLLFKNVDLFESNMKNCDFSYCDFSNANLEACDLSDSNLFSVTFSKTNLCYADLRRANLNNSIINKDKKYFLNTKIHIHQLKYFWPEVAMFYQCLQIYTDNNNLASKKDIEFELDKIRGFHLDI